MKQTPLSEHIGTEITGVQLSDLAGDDLKGLKRAVFENGVAVLRDQELSPEQHIAFAKRWGGIDVNPFFPTNSGWPELPKCERLKPKQATSAAAGTPITALIKFRQWAPFWLPGNYRRAAGIRCFPAWARPMTFCLTV